MNTLLNYIAYFENLATELDSIQHSEQEKHFSRIDNNELFENLKATIKERALLIEDYQLVPINKDDSRYRGITGAFSVVFHLGSKSTFDLEIEKQDLGEKICYEILKRIEEDIRGGQGIPKQTYFNTSDAEIMHLKNAPLGWFGARAEFFIQIPEGFCAEEGIYIPAFGTIKNSDNSYTAQVATKSIVTLPDENITINGNAFLTKPSVKNQNILLVDEEDTTIVPVSTDANKVILPSYGGGTASYVLKDTAGESISTGTIATGTASDIVAPDASYSLKDTAGATINTGSIKSNKAIDLTAPDANYSLKNSAGAEIANGNIKSNDSQDILAPDAEFECKYENGEEIEVGFIKSNGYKSIIVPNPITGWQRPSEWITLPTAISGTLYGLYLVFENELNRLSVQASTGTTNFDFENNGTNVLSNGAVQSYTYDYATLGGTINVYTEDGSNRNYKQVIFKLSLVNTSLNSIFLERNNGLNNFGYTNFADIDCNFSGANVILNVSTGLILNVGGYVKYSKYLRIFKCSSIGTNISFFSGFRSLLLKRFIVPSSIDVATTAFQGSIIDYDLENITAVANGLQSVRINSVNDLIITGGSALQSAVIGYCNNVIISGSVSSQAFFGTDINILGTINCTTTNFQRMFQGCTTRKLVFSAIPSNPTNISASGGAFTLMPNLEVLILPGLQVGFSIANSNMNAAALLALANSVGTANGVQTITTTGNPGAADTAYITLLNGKGYIVIN